MAEENTGGQREGESDPTEENPPDSASDPEESSGEDSTPSDVSEDDTQELSPEELAEQVTDDLQGEEDTSEEETSPGSVEEEAEQVAAEFEAEEEEDDEDTGDGVQFEGELAQDPEQAAEGPSEPPEESDDEESSIQQMLEEEAARSREETEEEDEELPEGYLTVDQLPEPQEFTIPGWMKQSGMGLLVVTLVVSSLWFGLMPLWESYLTRRIAHSLEQEQFGSASTSVRWGLFLNGLTIKYDDQFLADYLQGLLARSRMKRFQSEYEKLAPRPPGPRVQQTYAQSLLNRGEWERAAEVATQLQQEVSTRGFGYVFHAKARLQEGDLDVARNDLGQAQRWLGSHPAIKRLQRDIYLAEGQYEQALSVANELQSLLENSRSYEVRVRDYVQFAVIHRALNKYRASQKMLERALDVEPNHREALRQLARQYLLEGRWEPARPLVNGADYRRGFRDLYPFQAFGWWAATELALSDQEVNRAIRLVKRAEDLEPRNPEVNRLEGEIYLNRLSEPELAVKYLERAREFGLERLSFISTLARAHYEAGHYQQAARQFQALRKSLADTHPPLLYNIGSAYLGAGEYERARRYLVRSFEMGYQNQNSYNQWGLLLELQGQTQKAMGKFFEGIEWGQRNGVPVTRVRSNLNRLLEKGAPEPLSRWLAPLYRDLSIEFWQTLDTPTRRSADTRTVTAR